MKVLLNFIRKEKFFFIIQEFRLWYQETQCFYYSQTYDLTTSYQRSFLDDQTIPLWKRADERFFWNQPMLSELIDQAEVLHFFYIKKKFFFIRENIWILDGFNR